MAGEGRPRTTGRRWSATTNQKIYCRVQSYPARPCLAGDGTEPLVDHDQRRRPDDRPYRRDQRGDCWASLRRPMSLRAGRIRRAQLRRLGYGYDGPAWMAAFNAMVAAIRVGTSPPGLKPIIPARPMGASGVDVGMTSSGRRSSPASTASTLWRGRIVGSAARERRGRRALQCERPKQGRDAERRSLAQSRARPANASGRRGGHRAGRGFAAQFRRYLLAVVGRAEATRVALLGTLPANDPAGADRHGSRHARDVASANVLRRPHGGGSGHEAMAVLPYGGGAAVPYVNMITDGTGYVLRLRRCCKRPEARATWRWDTWADRVFAPPVPDRDRVRET